MKNRKGFTLAELLIVMAIIVVLAAVAVPTFGKQLETSRETGDMEVIRNAYTLAHTAAVQDGTDGIFDGKVKGMDLPDTAATSGIAITAVSGGQSATVAVTVGTAIPGAKFSQNGTTADGTSASWQYVSNSFMGFTVPPVCVKTTVLTFTFKFNATGEVIADDANGTTDGNPLFVAS